MTDASPLKAAEPRVPLPIPRTHRAAAVRALRGRQMGAATVHALLAIDERLDALVALMADTQAEAHGTYGRQTLAQQEMADTVLGEE